MPSLIGMRPLLLGLASRIRERAEVESDDEAAILDEAQERLQEATQEIRAVRNLLWASGMGKHPNYRELTHRVSSAPAMTEAAYIEARRRARDKGQ
jgi:hypothetical protein